MSVRRVAALAICAAIAALAALAVGAGRASTADEAGARADLAHLAAQMEQIHPNLFHGISRAEWRTAVATLDARLGSLGRDATLVEFMRLVALVSSKGRDGHMHALPADATHPGVLPLQLYLFSDGLYVVRAMAPHADLRGARVTAVGGHPIGDVIRAVTPLVARDNEATVPLFLPLYVLLPNVLSGLGLVAPDQPVPLTVADRAGRERTVTVGKVAWGSYVDWVSPSWLLQLPPTKALWLKQTRASFWWRYLPSSRALYVRYSMVRGPSSFTVQALKRRAARRDVARVVIDIRSNGGGDNTTYGSLLAALQRKPFNRSRRLYVLLGRLTFSAAGNFATQVDRTTRAVFVGEPMGGGLNQYGQGSVVTLSRLPIPLDVPVATQYYEYAPGDPRLTITPEVPAPLASSDYFGGRDPVLRAAIAHSRGS